MKSILKIFSAVLCAGAVLTLASCNKDEIQEELSTKGKTALDTPSGIAYEAGMSSATISWDAVSNAGQYYYEMRNSANYVASKGTTTSTTVTVNGLTHTSTYTLYLKALPSASDAKKYCASEEATAEITTQTKKVWNYAWSTNATVYFDVDKQNYKTSTVFGQEAGTGKYVVESYSGQDGFDFVFTVDSNGKMTIDPDSDIYIGVSGWATQLYHGIGGKSSSYIQVDEQYNDFPETNTQTGGTVQIWCYDPDGNWTSWNAVYGDGKGNASDEPDVPEGPTADATEDWTAVAKVTFAGEDTGERATISYTAADKTYTVSSWWGVEGYDIVFTRDADNGQWILDTEKSSAYQGTEPETGNAYALATGSKGVAWYYPGATSSGYDGDPSTGTLYSYMYDANGTWGVYQLEWPASNGDLDYSWHATGTVTFGDTSYGTAYITYDASTKKYTVKNWLGVEGYDFSFTRRDAGDWVVDSENSSAFGRFDDHESEANPYTAWSLYHGVEGTSSSVVWFYFYDNDSSYSGLSGNDKEGYIFAYGWDPNGVWTEYRLTWSEITDANWSAEATINCEDSGLPLVNYKTTLSFDASTGMYTLAKWWGFDGYDLQFTVENGEIIPNQEYSGFAADTSDRWNIYIGTTENTYNNSGTASIMHEGGSSFTGGSNGGKLILGDNENIYFWGANGWDAYTVTW